MDIREVIKDVEKEQAGIVNAHTQLTLRRRAFHNRLTQICEEMNIESPYSSSGLTEAQFTQRVIDQLKIKAFDQGAPS